VSPESRARAEAKVRAWLAEMPLNELRQARGPSQKMLAEVLHVNDRQLPRSKNAPTCIFSTLHSRIEARAASWRSRPAYRTGQSKSEISPTY